MTRNNKYVEQHRHKKYNKHKNNKRTDESEEFDTEKYFSDDMTYEEMCEFADFLCEFFKTAEEIAPVNNHDDDDLDYLDIFDYDGPER